MRLDPEHVEKLANAFTGDGEAKIDINFLKSSFERLSMWERGLLIESITRAVATKKPSREQRVILSLFVHPKGRES